MIVRYLFDSFKSPLPWTVCDDAWNETCVASGTTPTPEPIIELSTGVPFVDNTPTTVANFSGASKTVSSAELYFL